MRDPQRISIICNNLAELWQQVPDWRFGQLIENLKIHLDMSDLFFIEDEELIKKAQELIKQIQKYRKGE